MTIHQIDGESPVFEFATAKEIEGLDQRKVSRRINKQRAIKNSVQTEGLKLIQKRERAQYMPEQQLRGIKKLSDYIESDE